MKSRGLINEVAGF